MPLKALPPIFPLKTSVFRKIRFSFNDLSENSSVNGKNGCNLTLDNNTVCTTCLHCIENKQNSDSSNSYVITNFTFSAFQMRGMILLFCIIIMAKGST